MKKAEAFSINTICPDLFERILRPGVGVVGGAYLATPCMYLGFQIFLEITCLGLIYHNQKNSRSLDDQDPPRK